MLLKKMICLMILAMAGSSLLPNRASAVIKADLPVSKRFADAANVVIAKVTAVAPEKHLVEIAVVERLKGTSFPEASRIQFVQGGELLKAIAVGQPVVVFTKERASIHIADTWVVANAVKDAATPLWRVALVDTAASGKTFPGRTMSLIDALRETKAGKPGLLDEFSGKPFAAGVTAIGQLDVAKPSAIVSVDVNGDGKPDLLITAPAGVRLFLAGGGDAFTDATDAWGLRGVHATVLAASGASGDKKPDVILDGVLYLDDGSHLRAAPNAFALPPQTHVVGSALLASANAGERSAAFVLSSGSLLVFKYAPDANAAWTKTVDRALTAPGEAPLAAAFGNFLVQDAPAAAVVTAKSFLVMPLTADGQPADFRQLTGDELTRMRGFADGTRNPSLLTIDLNGDHRPDLLLWTDTASLGLINRGFGAFFPDTDAAAQLSVALSKVSGGPMGAIRASCVINKGEAPDELLLLTDDGKLLRASTAAAAK